MKKFMVLLMVCVAGCRSTSVEYRTGNLAVNYNLAEQSLRIIIDQDAKKDSLSVLITPKR
jgi:hypothetical protein